MLLGSVSIESWDATDVDFESCDKMSEVLIRKGYRNSGRKFDLYQLSSPSHSVCSVPCQFLEIYRPD